MQTNPQYNVVDHSEDSAASPRDLDELPSISVVHAEKKYPTRIQKVGEIQCLFLSFYKNGRYPFLSAGPSFCPCTCLFAFGCIVFSFFMTATRAMYDVTGAKNFYILCTFTQVLNFTFMLLGMCCDPGIPKSVIDLYVRLKYEKQSFTLNELSKFKEF